MLLFYSVYIMCVWKYVFGLYPGFAEDYFLYFTIGSSTFLGNLVGYKFSLI
jgi:hypothetical protein